MKSIHIVADTLPEAYEKAMAEVWNNGSSFRTQYDRKDKDGKFIDPLSKDCTALMYIEDPFKEPRVHRSIPMSIEDVERYRCEVVLGAHNYYMDDLSNPNRWEYTYHSRMRNYTIPCPKCCTPWGLLGQKCDACNGTGKKEIDQIEKCIEMLKETGYTRRAKIDIWDVEQDLDITNEHPPCLQYITLRIEDTVCNDCNGEGRTFLQNDYYEDCKKCDGKGIIPKLNMIVHIRSNDLFKAWPSNVHAFTELQLYIAQRLYIKTGSYTHIADSLHLYGSYFKEIEGFFKTMEARSFEDRTYTTEFCLPFFVEGCTQLLSEEKMPQEVKTLILERKIYLENCGKN